MRILIDARCDRCGWTTSFQGLDPTIVPGALTHHCVDGVVGTQFELTERRVPGPGERVGRVDPAYREFLPDVRKHATEFYNQDGWDFVVESMTDDEILDVLNDPITPRAILTARDAINAVGEVCKLLDERRREVRAEVF